MRFDDVVSLSYVPPEARLTYGDDPSQFAEGWVHTESLPTVLMIHGGCWLSDYDLTHARPFCAALATSGFNVWSLEYRRVGNAGGGWPGSFEDIVAGVRRISLEARHGTDDSIVPPTHSRTFAAASGARLVEIAAAGHFDLIHPGTGAFHAVTGVL